VADADYDIVVSTPPFEAHVDDEQVYESCDPREDIPGSMVKAILIEAAEIIESVESEVETASRKLEAIEGYLNNR
jgi:hypothetical protein